MDCAKSAYNLDGFLLSLRKTDTGMTIQAENTANSKRYSKKIKNSNFNSLNHGFFPDISTMCEAFSSWLEKEYTGVKMSMSSDAKLVFVSKVTIGPMLKEDKVIIPLEEEDIDPIQRLKSQVTKLSNRIMELENNQNFSIIPDLKFNPSSNNASNFTFSNDNSTISYKASVLWNLLFTTTPIKGNSKAKVHFKIVTSSENNIMFGVATASNLKSVSCYDKSGSNLYYGRGYIYEEGSYQSIGICPKAGDVVTVRLDLQRGRASYKVNGQPIFVSTKIDKTQEYYFVLELYNINDSISILEF